MPALKRIGFQKKADASASAIDNSPARIRDASSSIDNGLCPNDGAPLSSAGQCHACGFTRIVLTPQPVARRVGFNRRWVSGYSAKSKGYLW